MLSDEEWAELFEQGMAAAIIDRQGQHMPEADEDTALVRDALRMGGWQAAKEAMSRAPGQVRAAGYWVLLRGEKAGQKIELDASWTMAGRTAIKKVEGEYLLAENFGAGAEASRRLLELGDTFEATSKSMGQTGLQGLGSAAMAVDGPSTTEGDVRVWQIERDMQGQ
eukprot:89447-Amphidinium_carterae.1